MEFRKSQEKDIHKIMEIIKQAQDYFKENNIDQWQNNYPNDEVIKEDIKNNHSYVLVSNGEIVATSAVSFDGEETYNEIYEGSWITCDKYAVIHRIAVSDNHKGSGLSHRIVQCVEEMCREKNVFSIKVDTHKDNISMQNMLKKNGFKYCGIIHLSYGAERVAYEKILK